MLSKKLKKVILGFVTALCLTGSAMPVMADTVRFNVTVPGDPKSKRIPKSDDEQKILCDWYIFQQLWNIVVSIISVGESACLFRDEGY